MIEQYRPPHHEEFLAFMERAVPDLLGISLSELVDTHEFNNRVAELEAIKQKILLRDSDDDWPADMARPGYFRAARSGNDTKDKEDDSQKPVLNLGTLTSPYNTALIEALNTRLIDTIAANLPEEIGEAADVWRDSNIDQRDDILRYIYERLLSSRQKDLEDSPVEKNEFDQELYSITAIHPDNLAIWPNGSKVSCLGVSLIMTAFAKRAGADFIYTNTIYENYVAGTVVEQTACESVKNIAKDNGMTVSAYFDRIFGEAEIRVASAEDRVLDFHHAILIDDGEDWVYLDPYQNNFVRFHRSHLDVEKTTEDFKSDKRHAPGRTLLSSSYELIEKIQSNNIEIEAITKRVIEKNLQYLQPIIVRQRTEDVSFEELLDFVNAYSPDIQSMLGDIDTSPHKKEVIFEFGTNLQRMVFVVLSYQMNKTRKETASEPIDINADNYREIIAECGSDFLGRFGSDCAYRERFIDDFVGVNFEIILKNCGADEYYQGREFPDVTLEYAIPSFFPGVMALAHLRAWTDYGNNGVSVSLAEQTSSQITWHEAVVDASPRTTESLDALEQRLRKLKHYFVHSRVAWRLTQRAIERNGDGKEVDG
jgi:hypothetical protein